MSGSRDSPSKGCCAWTPTEAFRHRHSHDAVRAKTAPDRRARYRVRASGTPDIKRPGTIPTGKLNSSNEQTWPVDSGGTLEAAPIQGRGGSSVPWQGSQKRCKLSAMRDKAQARRARSAIRNCPYCVDSKVRVLFFSFPHHLLISSVVLGVESGSGADSVAHGHLSMVHRTVRTDSPTASHHSTKLHQGGSQAANQLHLI